MKPHPCVDTRRTGQAIIRHERGRAADLCNHLNETHMPVILVPITTRIPLYRTSTEHKVLFDPKSQDCTKSHVAANCCPTSTRRPVRQEENAIVGLKSQLSPLFQVNICSSAQL